MVELADANGKFRLLDFRWDLATPAFGVVLLGTICQNFLSYGTDQAVVQRYLTTRDEKSGSRNLDERGPLHSRPFIFWYRVSFILSFQDESRLLDSGITSPEALFPYYIVTSCPQV